MTTKPVIFCGMPHYNGVDVEAAKRFWCGAADDSVDHLNCDYSSSLLAHAFNCLWCVALNMRADKGITHFAMQHADLAPEVHWVNRLLEEMNATGADLVSAVVPIKSTHGVTSTAICSGDPYEVERRLTMREVMKLPATFDAESVGYPDRALLVNSGCFLVDFTKPWVEKVRFQISNEIRRGPDGSFQPRVNPEDWDFSRQVHRFGGKVVATRKVKIDHYGRHGFGNHSAWGSYEMDHMATAPLPVLSE